MEKISNLIRLKKANETLMKKDFLLEDAQRSVATDMAALAGLGGGMTIGAALSNRSAGGALFGGALGLSVPLIVNEYMKQKALQKAELNEHEMRQESLKQPLNISRTVKSVGTGLGAASLAGGATVMVAPIAAPVVAFSTYHTVKPLVNNIMLERKLKQEGVV